MQKSSKPETLGYSWLTSIESRYLVSIRYLVKSKTGIYLIHVYFTCISHRINLYVYIYVYGLSHQHSRIDFKVYNRNIWFIELQLDSRLQCSVSTYTFVFCFLILLQLSVLYDVVYVRSNKSKINRKLIWFIYESLERTAKICLIIWIYLCLTVE